MNVVRYGAMIPVSRELLEDFKIYREDYATLAEEMRQTVLDQELGPRYGPPEPRFAEPERCEHCGHILDDDGWD